MEAYPIWAQSGEGTTRKNNMIGTKKKTASGRFVTFYSKHPKQVINTAENVVHRVLHISEEKFHNHKNKIRKILTMNNFSMNMINNFTECIRGKRGITIQVDDLHTTHIRNITIYFCLSEDACAQCGSEHHTLFRLSLHKYSPSTRFCRGREFF